MSRTSILFGPPGTGKTTALLKEVDAALKSGVHPDRIAFFAFTRKAATEASARASEQFGLKEDDLAWFRTLHSAAFKLLGLSSTEVMQDSHYADFTNAMGRFRFLHSYNEDTERVPQGGAYGDLALGVYSRARSRCIAVEDEWRLSEESELTREDAVNFARALDDYKSTYQLLDFSDFLDEVHEPLDLDLLIIDEAQDLTYQQWLFVRRIGARAKRVIIAGDDDQAIFQWAGADFLTFLKLEGTRTTLPVSYRLPFRIWQKCQDIAQGINVRQKKDWRPRQEQGGIHYLDDVYHSDLKSGESWMLLARMRSQLTALKKECIAQGVVYQHEGIWSNQAPEVRAVLTYERLRRGESVTGARAQQLVNWIPNLTNIPRQDSVTWNDIAWPFEGMPEWIDVMRLMAVDEIEYIRRLRRNNESLSAPGRVVLSTIHGVKGGEADNVVLLSDINTRIYKGMEVDPDAEKRVWYVGASRAKHNLMIVKPTKLRHVLI